VKPTELTTVMVSAPAKELADIISFHNSAVIGCQIDIALIKEAHSANALLIINHRVAP
jgi:hypothetical protein